MSSLPSSSLSTASLSPEQQQFRQLNDKIEEVEEEIKKVEHAIQIASEHALTCASTDPKMFEYWRKEKEQLRKEKEQLRKKEEQIREEKILLHRLSPSTSSGKRILFIANQLGN